MAAFLVFATWLTAAVAPTPAVENRVLVLPVRASPAELEGTAALVTELVVGALRRDPAADVVSQREVEVTLQQQREQRAAGVQAEEGAAQVGAGVGADRVVAGELVEVGEERILTLSLVQVRDGALLGRASRRLARNQEDQWVQVVPILVAELTGRPVPAPVHAPPAPFRRRGPLQAVAGVGTGVGVLVSALAGVTVAGLLALGGADAVAREQRGMHLFPWSALVLGTVGLGVAGGVAVLALPLVLGGLAAWGAAWWL